MMRVLVIVLGLLALAPAARAERSLPVVVPAGRVTVRAEAGLEPQARELASRAAVHLARIESDLVGLPRVEHVEVRVVKRQGDLAAVAPPGRGAPPWASGLAYPNEGVVSLAARDRQGHLLDMERTLAHELAHMALDRALGEGGVPRWLTEGFAYLHSSDSSFGRAATLFGAVVRGAIIPIHELEHRFPAAEDEVALAYAQSYDLVAYLARRGASAESDDDGDRSAFRQFLARLAGGESLDGAALAAYGRTILQLEDEWLASLRSRYLWYPIGALGAFLWVVGGVLLFVGWLRRRRQMRHRLRQWEAEEAMEDATRLGPGSLH